MAEDRPRERAKIPRDRRARHSIRDLAPADDLGGSYRLLNPHLRAAIGRVRGPLEADDAAQEAWLALVERISSYRDDGERGDFLGWVVVVARNRLSNLQRRAGRRPEVGLAREEADGLVGREEDPALSHERRRVVEAVRAAVAEARDRVPEASHRIIVLRWLEERTVPEIARALGLTEAQVRDRHRRAFPILRTLLARGFGPASSGLGDNARDPGPEEVSP